MVAVPSWRNSNGTRARRLQPGDLIHFLSTRGETDTSASSHIPGHSLRTLTGIDVSPWKSRVACSGFSLSSVWMLLLSVPRQMRELCLTLATAGSGNMSLWISWRKDRQNRQAVWSLANLLKTSSQWAQLCSHTWRCSHSVPCWQTQVKAPIHPQLKHFVPPFSNAVKPSWRKAPPADVLPWKCCSNELAGKTVSQKEDLWAAWFTITLHIHRLSC